jgi:hypothetical protein
MDNWQSELRSTALEIESLMAQQIGSADGVRRKLLDQQIKMFTADLHLEAAVQKLRSSTSRKPYMTPRRAATVHWIGVATEKLNAYFEHQCQYLSKLMWLKLIRARIDGSSQSKLSIESLDILDMTTKRGNLRKTEKYLKDQLKNLLKEKERLHSEYRQAELLRANHTASLTLDAPLGYSWEQAKNNPASISMGRLLNKIKSTVRSLSIGRQAGNSAKHQTLSRESSGILNDCLSWARQDSGDGQHNLGVNHKIIRNRINQIDAIRNEISSLESQSEPPAHPPLNVRRPRSIV